MPSYHFFNQQFAPDPNNPNIHILLLSIPGLANQQIVDNAIVNVSFRESAIVGNPAPTNWMPLNYSNLTQFWVYYYGINFVIVSTNTTGFIHGTDFKVVVN